MALNFDIKLGDQVSPAAKSAASALTQLDSAIRQESSSLKALENQMRAVQKGGAVDVETYRKLSGAITDQKSKIAGLTTEMIKSGGAGFAPLKEKGAGLSDLLSKLSGESGAAGEALTALGPEGVAAAAGLGAVAIAGGALVVALGAVAGAVVYLESKLLSLGIQASEAKGDITRSLELLYGGEKAAEHTYKVLESLTGSVAISQDRVMDLADHLIKAGQVNGNAMVASIAAIGKAEAARKGAGEVLEGVITRASSTKMFSISRQELRSTGLGYTDLAKEISKGTGRAVGEVEIALRTGGVRATEGLAALNRVVDEKLGALANKKLQTVGIQTQRLKDNFMRLFEGFDTGPVARMLMAIGNLLDENSVSGAALRTVLKSAFDEISSAIESATPIFESLFKGGILLALKLYNALYPVRKAIKDVFGGGIDSASFEDSIIGATTAIGNAVGALAEQVAPTIPIVRSLYDALGTTATVIGVLVQPIESAVSAFVRLQLAIVQGWTSLLQLDFGAVGRNIVNGLVNGITSGASAVGDALQKMARDGLTKFKDVFGIHSPSKVMQLQGGYLNQGLAKGIEQTSTAPAQAMAKGAPGVAGAAGAGGTPGLPGVSAGRGGGAPQVHVVFQAGAIQAGHGVDVAGIKSQLTELMADVFQQAAAMQGAG